jgi:hypothetical protein
MIKLIGWTGETVDATTVFKKSQLTDAGFSS